jgi:hypothetical protein
MSFDQPEKSQLEKNIIKEIDYESWKDSLPQVHWNAMNAFRDFEPTYFMDTNGDHYVIYTEDGERRGRKLYITANNAGISAEISPSEIEK